MIAWKPSGTCQIGGLRAIRSASSNMALFLRTHNHHIRVRGKTHFSNTQNVCVCVCIIGFPVCYTFLTTLPPLPFIKYFPHLLLPSFHSVLIPQQFSKIRSAQSQTSLGTSSPGSLRCYYQMLLPNILFSGFLYSPPLELSLHSFPFLTKLTPF